MMSAGQARAWPINPRITDHVMAFYEFTDQETGLGFGSCEIWFTCGSADIGGDLEPGWYWWACFPGCLPDGEPAGPFETEALAIADADVWVDPLG